MPPTVLHSERDFHSPHSEHDVHFSVCSDEQTSRQSFGPSRQKSQQDNTWGSGRKLKAHSSQPGLLSSLPWTSGKTLGDVAQLRASVEKLSEVQLQLCESMGEMTSSWKRDKEERESAQRDQSAGMAHIITILENVQAVQLENAQAIPVENGSTNRASTHRGSITRPGSMGIGTPGTNPIEDQEVVKLIQQDKAFGRILARLQAVKDKERVRRVGFEDTRPHP